MRKHVTAFLITIAFITMGISTGQAWNLYDDFSGTHLNSEKWEPLDRISELYIDQNKVHAIFNGFSKGSGYEYVNLSFPNPGSIYAIKATVTILSSTTTQLVGSKVQLGGHFYNDPYGVVWCEVSIVDTGSGLEAQWTLHSNGSGTGLNGGILKDNLQYNTPYVLSISYNEPANQFTFSADGSTANSAGIDKQGSPSQEWKTIDVGVCCSPQAGPASMTATIDDVYINNESSVYDDFSGTTIDTSKWNANSRKLKRIIENGSLTLEAEGYDKRTQINIVPATPEEITRLGGKIIIENTTSIQSGANGKFRIGSAFYNESRGTGCPLPHDGYLGDVWSEVRIDIDDTNTLSAVASVSRADSNDWSLGTPLYTETFTTPIQFGNQYSLSLQYLGSRVFFRCNGEVLKYDIETSRCEPYNDDINITTRVNLDSGESGKITATVDDIFINGALMAPATLFLLLD